MQSFKMIITPKSCYGEVSLSRVFQLINAEGMIALNCHHFTISSEIIDLDKKHQ